MHFSLPTPIHGWREFAGEITIIVVGVLIALTADELVQRYNWREQVREARETLDTQLAEAQYAALERIATSECTNRKLDQLDELIEGDTVPEVDLSGISAIRLWSTSSWDAATSSGAVAHMTPDLRNRYADLFSFTSVLGEQNREEYRAVANLQTITKHPHLTETSRDRLSRDLAQIRSANNLLTLGARQWVEIAKPLKLIPEEDVRVLLKKPACGLPNKRA